MSQRDYVVKRLEDFIREATALLEPQNRRLGDLVPRDPWWAWRTACEFFLTTLLDRDNPYWRTVERFTDNPHAEWVERVRVLLERMRDDYAAGYIRDPREVGAAEVFTDFLDMAQHLHAGKYHHAAASIAGAVLEDFLRRLYLRRIPGGWEGDSSLSKLNDGLWSKKVYNQSTWRQVQAWGDIRNHADHGEWEEVKPRPVGRMIEDIRAFMALYES